MEQEIFTKVKLPTGTMGTILEGYGRHYFKALQRANGDQALIIKYLIIELVMVNDKELSESDVDNMHMRDISYVAEVIGTMLSNDYMKGL